MVAFALACRATCLCCLGSVLKASASDRWPIQKHLSPVPIDPDHVCIGHKSNYSPNIASNGRPKADRNAGISANCRCSAHSRLLDDRFAFNEGQSTVIKFGRVSCKPCVGRPVRRGGGKRGRKWCSVKLPHALSFETVLHECRVKGKELS